MKEILICHELIARCIISHEDFSGEYVPDFVPHSP
jgi:hypothetical protein